MEDPPRLNPFRKGQPSNLIQVLDALEEVYGPQKAVGPADPHERFCL
jgi:hypothetical protein